MLVVPCRTPRVHPLCQLARRPALCCDRQVACLLCASAHVRGGRPPVNAAAHCRCALRTAVRADHDLRRECEGRALVRTMRLSLPANAAYVPRSPSMELIFASLLIMQPKYLHDVLRYLLPQLPQGWKGRYAVRRTEHKMLQRCATRWNKVLGVATQHSTLQPSTQ